LSDTLSQPPSRPLFPYRYEAQDAEGNALRGTLEAGGAADAEARLAALGLRAIAVDPEPAAGEKRARALGAEDFMLFNRQLAHLTKAGLPVERGLRLIAGDMKSGRLAAAARAVAADLEKGKSLPEAFAAHAKRFPPLYGRLMEAGIRSGDLPAMLFSLGRHLELAARLRQMLWNTLAYPVSVLVGLTLVMCVVAAYILPMMHSIYGDMHVQLPVITRAFLWFGEQLPLLLKLGGVLAAVLLLVYLVQRLLGKSLGLREHVLASLPAIGPILRRGQLARWCDALKIAVEAGLDLPAGLELASQAVGSRPLLRDGLAMADIIRRGGALDAGVALLVIPPAVPAAIGITSRTGDLPMALATLSRMYAEQAEQRLRALPAIVTPILFVFIATGFGLTLMAMFFPLIRLIQSLTEGFEE
jgi:type II secretory pathway component PulF